TENIYFAFDSDSAGLKALERSIIMAGVQGFAVKSINLGKFKDPDDMIQESLDRWKAAVSDAVDSIEYLINLYAKELNLNSADGKSKLVKKISPFIKSNKDQIKADHYIKLIAQKGQISEGVLREALGVELEGFATNKESENPEKVIHETLSRFEYILSLVFLHPELVSEITDLTFPKKIRSILDKFQIESDLKNLREKLNEAECKIFDKVVLVDIKHDDKKHMKEDFEKVKKDIKKEMIRRRILKLEESIRQKESSGSSIDDDLRQLGVLTNKLRSI
ncbi:MAG TPA: toprim domain-containing protein, partial [Candidatus Dojkabacteria bacterium]